MRMLPLLLLLAALLSLSAPATSTAGPFQVERHKLDRRLLKCADWFGTMQADAKTAIPAHLLRRARGVIILRHVKAGLLVGGDGGRGIALVRHPETGRWSAPAFVVSAGASYGLQAGVKQSTIVLLLMNDEALRALVGGSLNVGADLEAVAGPRDASVSGDSITADAPVFIYSDSGGLFAGIALKGGVITPAKRANQAYYGRTLSQVVFEHSVRPSRNGIVVIETIQRGGRPAPPPVRRW